MFRLRAVQLLAITALWLVLPARALGQYAAERAAPPAAGEAVVAPGPEYAAGSLAQRILGANWRELWTTPVEAPLFDLDAVAGGLDWVRRGGGHQSITLHLVERNGWREYRFRSVNKFPVIQAMPDAVRRAPAGHLVQDQVSTLFPAAPLGVPPLMEAAGLLHVRPELYVMSDDPRLEVYQDTFAGMIGTFELKPDEAPDDEPGFAGSQKTKSTENFFDDLSDSRDHRLDEGEFLAARLIDFLINDTDRTPDNFRWSRFGEEPPYLWRPVPIDRDRAFMHAGGLVNLLVRRVYPKLTEFAPDYSLRGLTHTSHPLDRRLLQRLTREDFEETAARVQRDIDDDVIEAVIESLPPSWRRTGSSDRLRRVLTARRDRLPAVALDFYDDLVGEVDVHGTEEPELARVLRHADGRVTLTVTGWDAADRAEVVRHDDGGVTLTLSGEADPVDRGPPFYQRTFRPNETNEIRIYLAGGDDLAVVRGASSTAIAVRVIGGAGDDVLVDSAGGGATYFYDEEGDNRFVTPRGTGVDVRPWDAPEQTGGLRLGQAWSPDWGGGTSWTPTLDYSGGSGLILGYGPNFRSYGFRRLPHHWDVDTKLAVGLASGRVGATANIDYRFENSAFAWTLATAATQLENLRFYGFGNDTGGVPHELARMDQNVVSAEPSLIGHLGWRAREGVTDPLRGDEGTPGRVRPLVGRLEVGPVLLWSDPRPRAGAPARELVGQRLARGTAGLRLGLELDRTDRDQVPTSGWIVRSRVAAYPPVWDVAESFGTATAEGAAYLPLPVGGAHIAVRAGGTLTSGPTPIQHAATVGGRTTLRGYHWQRFTGDTSAYGSTELRVPVGTVPLFVRWDVGVFALADAGRAWFDGSSPGGWHTGVGGGIWLSALGQAFSFAVAHGEESRVYVQRGLSF